MAEELAQETFLVAYRDWDRISRLDNPRAWVRRVAINQRGSFLRAYLRQQTRERHAAVRHEDDRIKLADEHAEVWQAVRTLPPLQAQVIALHYYEDDSVAQVDAASRLREIVRRTDQPVAHGRTAVVLDEPQESPRSLASSLPASGKVSASAAESSAAATPTSHWTDGETRSTFHSQPHSENAVDGLLQSIWCYRRLIAAAVLLGALLGYGWAARQPTLYEGVATVALAGPGSTSPSGDPSPPPVDRRPYIRQQAQLVSSPVVLERAVKRIGNRISAETLSQRVEVEVADVAQDVDLVTIRVVDSTATGAAQLADAVATAYGRVLGHQSGQAVSQLRNTRSRLKARLAELVSRPDDPVLRAKRAVVTAQLSQLQRELVVERTRQVIALGRAAVPQRPISPSPGRPMAIGMLLGLLASAVLVWWRRRGQGPTSRSSAPEQGPEMPGA